MLSLNNRMSKIVSYLLVNSRLGKLVKGYISINYGNRFHYHVKLSQREAYSDGHMYHRKIEMQ